MIQAEAHKAPVTTIGKPSATAHYFSGRGQKYLIISSTFSPIGGSRISVSGKIEARRIAAQHDAQPWNF